MGRRRSRVRSDRKKYAALKLMGGVVLAVLLGVLLGNLYFNRIQDSDPGKQPTSPQEPLPEEIINEEQQQEPSETEKKADNLITTQIPSLSVYRVQAGAFSQRENAQILLTELQQLGFQGIITAGDGYFRVNIGTFMEKEAARKFAVLASEQGDTEELVVAGEVLPETNIVHSASETSFYNSLPEVIAACVGINREIEALWYSHICGEKSATQVLSDAGKIEESIISLTRLLEKIQPTEAQTIAFNEVKALSADAATTLRHVCAQAAGENNSFYFADSLARLIKVWPQLKQ